MNTAFEPIFEGTFAAAAGVHLCFHHQFDLWPSFGLASSAALLRWRRPEARLLFVMACAPQNLGWYDQVPLSIIPGTFRQVLVFSLLSYVPLFLVPFVRDPASTAHSYEILSRMVICACYIPCLLAVLARPNEGGVPAFLERWIRRLPPPIRARL